MTLINRLQLESSASVTEQIKRFVRYYNPQSETFKNKNIELRLRIKDIWLEGHSRTYTAVVIAEIVLAEHLRGKGTFGKLVKAIANTTQHKMIYIECVGNKRFAKFLERTGWIRDTYGSVYEFNYFKKI